MKKEYISDENAGLVTMRDPMVLVYGDTIYYKMLDSEKVIDPVK